MCNMRMDLVQRSLQLPNMFCVNVQVSNFFKKRAKYAPSISLLQARRLYREVSVELHFSSSVSLKCLGLNSFLCPVQCNVTLTRFLTILCLGNYESWEDLTLRVLGKLNEIIQLKNAVPTSTQLSAKEILAISASLLIIFVNFRDLKKYRLNFRNYFFF